MPRRKQRSDAQVLDAILPVILARGLHRVTLPELGEAAGLSPATLLQRFGSRTEVIEAALDQGTAALEAELDRPPCFEEDPRAALIHFLLGLAAPIGDRERLAGSLEILGRDMVVPHRNLAARRHLGLVRARIARGLEAMGHAPDEAQRRALTVEALWHGLAIQWALHGEGRLDDWLRVGLEDVLAEGAMPRAAAQNQR